MAANEVNIYEELKQAMDEIEWSDGELEEGELKDLIKFPVPSTENKEIQPVTCKVKASKGKTFTKVFALKRHWREVHQKAVQLMECTQCTKVFRQNSDLKRHFVAWHGQISQRMSKVVSRPNKFFVYPEGIESP